MARRKRRRKYKPKSLSSVMCRLHPDPNKRRKRYRELDAMTYKEYLWSTEWGKFRMEILKRDGFKCKNCKAGDSLQVHHHHYQRVKREKPVDCVTLCESCHVDEEAHIKKHGRRWTPRRRRKTG